VIEQVLDRSVNVTDRRDTPLREDLTRRLLGGGCDEPVPRAEVSKDGLDVTPARPATSSSVIWSWNRSTWRSRTARRIRPRVAVAASARARIR
jgi:hypothetical protein